MESLQPLALVNGHVQTMDAACTTVQAVLVAQGRIMAVGSTEEILAAAGTTCQVIDLHGRALYPGFIDSHSHPSTYAAYIDKVYCGAEVGSVAGALERLTQRAKQTPPGEFVLGWGYDDTILPEKRGLLRTELDAITSDHPILVIHMSAHVAYANSKMLELAGYTAETTMEGGEVVLDADGVPNGTLLEMAAFNIMELLPKPGKDILRGGVIQAIHNYNAQGFTAIHEGGVIGGIDPHEYFRLLQELEQENALNASIHLSHLPETFDELVAVGIMPGYGNAMLRIGGPKMFSDGSIQMGTAALLSPYHHRPDHRGELLMAADKLTELIIRYHCAGFQISCHGNGDAGIECIISAIEKAQAICPRKEPRHVLVHCQTASDAQLERMQRAGIVPTFFGLHVWYFGDRHHDVFLGPERAERLDPSGSAVRMGMVHSLHHDTPVMPPTSIQSIHTAVNRLTYNGRLLGADQRISAEEAVRAYTSNAAWMQFEEHRRGTIEPGKQADFVLLSHDLLTMPPQDINKAEVLMTMVEGRIVYGATPTV